MKIQFPPFLHEGDKVAIVSPSGKIDNMFLRGAKAQLASWGLVPEWGNTSVAPGDAMPAPSGSALRTFRQQWMTKKLRRFYVAVAATERFILLNGSTSPVSVNTRSG